MAIYLEFQAPNIRTKPPTGYPRLDRGIMACNQTYHSMGSPKAAGHVESVLGISLRNRIIEPEHFNDGSKPPEINERLLYIVGTHLLKPKGVSHIQSIPECFRRYKRIRDQFEIFCALRDLDLKNAPLGSYVAILTYLPEALLARLADVAEYHDPKWRSDSEGINHKYLFESGLTADQEQLRIARIGRLLYGPLADFLGYRRLSGEIAETSALVLFPETYSEVASELVSMNSKIQITNLLAYGMAKKIHEFCEREGIPVDISLRSEKSIGKIVEKVRYYRSHSGENRPNFSVADLSDLVAFKVVVKDTGPHRKLSEDEKLPLIYRIRNFIQEELQDVGFRDFFVDGIEGLEDLSLKGLKVKIREQDYFRKRKSNNYRSIHFDFKMPKEQEIRFADFEIQLTTEEGDFWARRGGAAHFAYNTQRYSGTTELKMFNITWAKMMDALKTGMEGVVDKYLVPSVTLTTVIVDAQYADGQSISRSVIEIPSNRLVADALVRAGIDITKGNVVIRNGTGNKLDTALNGIGSLSVTVDPKVGISSRFAATLLQKCGEVDTAVLLAKYIATTDR